jgi:UrcA family protein
VRPLGILVACACVCSAVPSTATAQESRAPSSVAPARVRIHVPTKHVDLATPAGRASFYRRLERAARRACDYGNIPGYYDRECAADALERAVWSRGVVALIELHEQVTGGGRPRRDGEVVRLLRGSDRPLEFCRAVAAGEGARRSAEAPGESSVATSASGAGR